MKSMRAFLAFAFLSSILAPAAMADSDAAMAEINALKARLAELEAKVASAPAPVAASGAPVLTLPSMMEGVELSGFGSASYNYNFASPDTNAGGNRGRIFDSDANTFSVPAAELVFKKVATADSRIGFRTDLYFGRDASNIHSVGLGSTSDFDLEQAYVEILAPTSNWGWNDIDIKAGKFVTPLGAEVIESKDNWNSSRGFLFNYAIPLTHTGVWSTMPFETFGQAQHVGLGVVNGWDAFDDNNNDKSILWQYGLDSIAMPGESTLILTLTGVVGSETTAVDSDTRNVTDFIAVYKSPWKGWTFMYNYDYGHQDNGLSANNDSNWDGHAVYARYDINDQWSLSGRWEFFDDEDHVRIALAAEEYWEGTITLEYRPWANLITRLEYRHDDADGDAFIDGGGVSDTQDTIGAEVIFTF